MGGAIGQVFFQQATKEKQETGSATVSFNNTLKKLIVIGLPVFTLLYFTVEDLFAFIFGEEWRVAGTYAKILIPLFAIRFVIAPLTVMNIIFKKNHIGMYWQFSMLAVNIIVIYVSYILNYSFINYLYLSTLFISLEYLLILYIIKNYNTRLKNV